MHLPDTLFSPMEGVFTPWFVRACMNLGLVRYWMTPFISVTGGSVPSSATIRRRLAPWRESGAPFAVQLLGRDSGSLIRCAEHVFRACGERPVNLNFACPSPTVNRNGAGAVLLGKKLPFVPLTTAFKKAFPAVPLSLKLRAGVHAENTREIVSAAAESGVDVLIFHGRTRDEMYAPVPELHARIAEAVHAAGKVPVIGNGDILSLQDALRMKSETDCAGVALARGFLKDPGLLRSIENGAEESVPVEFLLAEMRRLNAPLPLIRAIQRMSDFFGSRPS